MSDKRMSLGLRRNLPVFQFILPFLILYLTFRVFPILYAAVLSFHKWNGMSTWNFVALDNFVQMVRDPIAIKAFANTLRMAFGQLLISVPGALILALLVTSKYLRGNAFFQTIFFLPRVVAFAVSVIIFSTLFNDEYGAINYALSFLGIDGPAWLRTANWARISIVIIRSWVLTGLFMIYFIAGLQSIPQELYQAADIDGARWRHRLFYITIPLLQPVTLFVMVVATVQAFSIFAVPYMLTSGGPDNATRSILMYMVQRGTTGLRFGYAAAVSVSLTVLLGLLAWVQFRLQNSDASGGR